MHLRLIWLLVIQLLSGAAEAEIWMPAYFGNNMVLQRASKTVIWGLSDLPDGEARIGEQSGRWEGTRVSERGRGGTTMYSWKLEIDLPAGAGPYSLKIGAGRRPGVLRRFESTEDITFTNVMIGDVWLQGVGNENHTPSVILSPQQRARLESIRVITAPGIKPLLNSVPTDRPGWQPLDPSTVSIPTVHFLLQMHANPKQSPIGVILVPHSAVLVADLKKPDLLDSSLEKMRVSAVTDTEALIHKLARQHHRKVTELKMRGICTNASPPEEWSPIGDLNRVSATQPVTLAPLSIRGMLW